MGDFGPGLMDTACSIVACLNAAACRHRLKIAIAGIQGIHRRSDFTRETMFAANDFAMANNAAPKARAWSHNNSRLRTTRRTPTGFAERMRLHISEHSARAFETLTQRIAERLTRPSGHDFIRKSDIARIHVNTTSRRNANAHDGFAMRKSLGTHVIDKVKNTSKHDFPTLLRIGRNRALRKNDGCSIGVFITHDGTRNFRSAHINSNNAEWIFQRKTSKTIPIAQRRDRGFPQENGHTL